MATIIDNPEYSDNEVYLIDATDSVEGAAIGASFNGIGVSNQPHQQLANRTAKLKQRLDADDTAIAALQAFVALAVGTLAVNGISTVKLPFRDSVKGLIQLIAQFGFYNIGDTTVPPADKQISVFFPSPFPTALLCPPLLTNVYISTGGRSLAASVLNNSWSTKGFTLVFDTPGSADGSFNGPEHTSGVSYLALGY